MRASPTEGMGECSQKGIVANPNKSCSLKYKVKPYVKLYSMRHVLNGFSYTDYSYYRSKKQTSALRKKKNAKMLKKRKMRDCERNSKGKLRAKKRR
jgi:hypothetical protein